MQKINPWRKVYDLPQSKDPFKYGVPKFALYLDIEPTNDCILNCLFCVRRQMKRPVGYMPLKLVEEISKQAKEYGAYGIRLLRWGEPLMHPDIVEMVKIISSYGLLSHITTNGILLDKKMSRNLIDAGLTSINISMQGTTTKEYKLLRNNDYLPLISENIKQLMKMKKTNPHVHISTTITDETDEDVKRWKKKWEPYSDSTGVGYTWFRRLKDKSLVKDFLPREHPMKHRFKCIEVMIKLSIDWDGTVSPCCLDYDQQLSIGNIYETNLKDLFNSPQAKAIRTLLSQERQYMFDLCKTCELNYDFRGK